jgi:pimeloyl-ACP methyl ester carboxylesterase
VAAVVPGQVASADTTGGSHQAKPTVVLVHGAWADGSSWNAVVKRLQHAGYPVRVPPNPLRSLSGDSAAIASFLCTIAVPIVLVEHSYGGAVITNVANGITNVKASQLYATQRPIAFSAGNEPSGAPGQGRPARFSPRVSRDRRTVQPVVVAVGAARCSHDLIPDRTTHCGRTSQPDGRGSAPRLPVAGMVDGEAGHPGDRVGLAPVSAPWWRATGGRPRGGGG